MEKCKKQNHGKGRKFFNVFRFIDDLFEISDGGEFANSSLEICPPELVLNKENESYLIATFLDLEISISQNIFDCYLYDKLNVFPF